jgi:hypothetical protein
MIASMLPGEGVRGGEQNYTKARRGDCLHAGGGSVYRKATPATPACGCTFKYVVSKRIVARSVNSNSH